jgi:hypothetical protein
LEELSFVRNTNGMANGPKTAPIIAYSLLFYQQETKEEMHRICILLK